MSLQLLSINVATGCIALVLFGVISSLLYLIYKFSIKEKSFEEVIEEQRKRTELEEMQQKNEKTKKEKEKKHKKWGKKKEKSEQSLNSELSANVTSESTEEIEIIEPKENVQSKKKSKVSNQKAATSPAAQPLSSKPVAESPAVLSVSSPKEAEKKGKPEPAVTKDKEKSKENSKTSDSPKIQTAQVEKTESVPVQSVPVVSSATTSKKKKKVELSDKADVGQVSASSLFSMIKEAALGDEESQMLIDILLNKQKEATGWKKAKKTTQDKEQTSDSQASSAKNVRQESNLSGSKISILERSYQEKLASQSQELKASALRLKQCQEQLAQEKASVEEKRKQMEKLADEKLEATTKKLAEEKDKLAKAVKRFESESRAAAASTELEKLKKSREDLQKVHSLLVEQHTQHISGHKRELINLNAQLADARKLQHEAQEKHATSSDDIAALKKRCEALESTNKKALEEAKANDNCKAEITHLKKLLDESKLLSADLDTKAKTFSEQVAELTKHNNKLSSDLKNLQTENERITTELTERAAIGQHNGEVNGKEKEAEKEFIDHEKILKEKETAITQLYDDLNSCKIKIVSLDEEITQQKQKNNELREKNWKIVENLKAAEEATEKLRGSQSASEELKKENLQYQASQKELTDRLSQTEESLAKLKELSNSQLHDYELKQQQKTSQLSSELTQLKSSKEVLESTLSNTEKNAEKLQVQFNKTESDVRSCLQRIFPSINQDNSLPLDSWLPRFEKDAVAALQSTSHSHSEAEERLARFVSEKEELQAKLAQYETVLAETLQEQLQSLQSEVDASKAENVGLNQKLEEVNQNYINLKQQIDSKDKTVEELQKEVSSFDHLKKELEDVKSKLEKEKKISKDFSTQMVRLDSLVKIGQDSLNAEQETVKKLQSQLQAMKVASTSNGTSSPTIAEDKTDASAKK